MIARLREGINTILSRTDNVIRILHFMDEEGNIITDPAARHKAAELIEKVDTEAVIEVGPRIHRVHSHILLMIQHRTRLQIDVQALRDSVRDQSWLEGSEHLFKNPIVRVKFIKENPINAIRKYQRGYKHKLPASLMRKVMVSNPVPAP